MPVATASPATPLDNSVVDPTAHRRRAWFLLAFAAWNVFVWGTRMRNLLGDGEPHSAAFIAVHVVLYLAGFGGAAVLTVIGTRMRREAAQLEQATQPTSAVGSPGAAS